MQPRFGMLIVALILFFALVGCENASSAPPNSITSTNPQDTSAPADFTILSGSENESLKPIIKEFADQKGVTIALDTSKGSVDIMLALKQKDIPYDAVWPASHIWTDLAGTPSRISRAKSIMKSPVVFAVRKSLAEQWGWTKTPVRVSDILAKAQSGDLRWMMTSASQSNSGACFYLACVNAFAGNPSTLTAAMLENPQITQKIKSIFGTVTRSAGSTGFLKKTYLNAPKAYGGMATYESLMIETNQALIASGEEPLYAVYPTDGVTFADSPLGYVDRGDNKKQALFDELQAYLLSPAIQSRLLDLGRRVGLGTTIDNPNPAVFNPEWGIRATQKLPISHLPEAATIKLALDKYQTAFRKPSLNIFVLDYSGSMEGERVDRLKTAMGQMLDQTQAKDFFLQASERDINVVITFNSAVDNVWEVKGNKQSELMQVLKNVNLKQPQGGTAIYTALETALSKVKQYGSGDTYLPAIILLTDGESRNSGVDTLEHLQQVAQAQGFTKIPPIFAMKIGEASADQLQEVVKWSNSGDFFADTSDLPATFRKIKGYN